MFSNLKPLETAARLSKNIQVYIDEMIKASCEDLDTYLYDIDQELQSEKPVTDDWLENKILNIPSIIYQVICNTENYITKEAVAKMIEKEKASKVKADTVGTVAIKQATADTETQEEQIVHLIYTNVNKGINKRIECANDMLNSLKKVLSRRLADLELSNNKFSGRRRSE